jgi:hypothetical protein
VATIEASLSGGGWFRLHPIKAILLTGLAGGAGAGFVVALVLFSPLCLLGAGFGLVGGAFASVGVLVARAIAGHLALDYSWEWPMTLSGAITGIAVGAYVLFPSSWVEMLPITLFCASLAAIGFGFLAYLRRPLRVTFDPGAAWEDTILRETDG